MIEIYVFQSDYLIIIFIKIFNDLSHYLFIIFIKKFNYLSHYPLLILIKSFNRICPHAPSFFAILKTNQGMRHEQTERERPEEASFSGMQP